MRENPDRLIGDPAIKIVPILHASLERRASRLDTEMIG